MKYGATLQQRSIPLWESYNVDYNDIKHLIKARTTQAQGQARLIPGSDNEIKASHAFEQELYHELRQQHQRIDLFVQSKAGEIKRRLAHLDKQIAQLEIRSFPTAHGKIPVRRLEKFSKLEEAAIKAGDEIQSLSRFVGAQRLAFQKLLKKYRKWTGSSELGNRFRKEVLDRRISFSKTDFEPLLAQWTEVLASVRAPFIDGINWQSRSKEPEKKEEGQSQKSVPQESPSGPTRNQAAKSQHAIGDLSSAAVLQAAWEDGSALELDTALATTPFGARSAKAAYWVHPDNIVQIHVLLLQYTRLQKSNETSPSPERPSSPRASISGHPAKCSSRTDEELGVIICDDLERFAKRQSSETVGDAENHAGLASEKAAASIRYSPNGDAVIVVGAATKDNGKTVDPGRELPTRKVRVKRKAIQRIFSTPSGNQGPIADISKDSDRVSEWLAGHREVQPLVQLRLRRTRFVGLKNNATNGLWATLDKDVSSRRCSAELLADDKGFEMINGWGKDSETFPHAVLEIRTEGPVDTDVIAALDASYLTERIRGFSLEKHAVATLCKPQGMPRPFWLPALKEDIRKVPTTSTAPKARKSQGRSSPAESNTRHTSISTSSTRHGVSSSGFSALHGESSATSAPDTLATPPLDATKKKKRRRSNRKQILQNRLQKSVQPRSDRYWNEFDDGSEGSQDEAYTIFVDPHASYSIPGAAAVSRLFESLTSSIKAAEVLNWFRSSQKIRHGEHRSLVSGERSPSTADSDQSEVDSSNRPAKRSPRRHYSTFHALSQPPAVRAREVLLFRSCLASFASSSILLIVAAVLVTTGRRKAATTVDAGVVIGVSSSLVFGVMGVGSMKGRRDDVGWVHRSIVFSVFICIVLAGSILLAALRHAG